MPEFSIAIQMICLLSTVPYRVVFCRFPLNRCPFSGRIGSRMVIVMTDFEFQVLSFINDSKNGASWVDVLNAFLGKQESMQTDNAIQSLLASNLIEKNTLLPKRSNTILRITGEGRIQLMLEEEHREKESALQKEKMHKHAKQKRQQRFDNKIAIAGLLMQPILFILGILAEHFFEIVNFVTSLFH